jgi:hypothetical protein
MVASKISVPRVRLTNFVIEKLYTMIPRLTSGPANEFFRLTKIFFRCFSDSANECFSGCARANIKQQT